MTLSPDGQWLAYESSESGTREIYLEPFPQTGSRTRVTTGGGRRPLWSPDGKELFFDRDDARLYVVPVETRPEVRIGTPMSLPTSGFLQGGARRRYDITPDGYADRKLALRLTTLTPARRLRGSSWQALRRAIGPPEVIRPPGSTRTEVDAEDSLGQVSAPR
jgi:WD40-like Beta Propeller Repeat